MTRHDDDDSGLAEACAELGQMLADLDACEYHNGEVFPAAASALSAIDRQAIGSEMAMRRLSSREK